MDLAEECATAAGECLARLAVAGLDDDGAGRAVVQLFLRIRKMWTGGDGHQTFAWNELFGSAQGMPEHGTAPEEATVLFRTISTELGTNEGLKSLPFAAGKHNPPKVIGCSRHIPPSFPSCKQSMVGVGSRIGDVRLIEAERDPHLLTNWRIVGECCR